METNWNTIYSRPIDGISTYNVIPFEAGGNQLLFWLWSLNIVKNIFSSGQYFNKIQCFCFEEQRLNPGEEVWGFKYYQDFGFTFKVDMPVFFYIDPDYVDDPFLENTDEITLSYTFFESK